MGFFPVSLEGLGIRLQKCRYNQKWSNISKYTLMLSNLPIFWSVKSPLLSFKTAWKNDRSRVHPNGINEHDERGNGPQDVQVHGCPWFQVAKKSEDMVIPPLPWRYGDGSDGTWEPGENSQCLTPQQPPPATEKPCSPSKANSQRVEGETVSPKKRC